MASFEELRQAAKEHPVSTTLPPLAPFYLKDLKIYNNIKWFTRDLYDPNHLFKRDIIVDTEERTRIMPRIECTESPFTPKLNKVINWSDPDHHNILKDSLLNQSELGDYITSSITNEQALALIIIDGLSYETLKRSPLDVQPVYVDGITKTDLGHRRIIYGRGTQSISSKLLSKHRFRHPKGYTYWERGQNKTSDLLYQAIHDVEKITRFEEIIENLECEGELQGRTYLQITRMGLDQQSHRWREEPDIKNEVSEIIEDIQSLQKTLEDISDSYKIVLTADHGILWRNDLPEKPPIVRKPGKPARYLKQGTHIRGGIIVDECDGKKYTGMGYPYLTRNVKANEWGLHGGFSYQESIIPYAELSGGTNK